MIIFKKQKHFKNRYVVGSGFVDIIKNVPLLLSEGVNKVAIPALTTATIAGLTGIGTTAINKLVDKVKKRIDNKSNDKINNVKNNEQAINVSTDIAKKISEKSKEIINGLQSNDINAKISGMGNKKIGKGIKIL